MRTRDSWNALASYNLLYSLASRERGIYNPKCLAPFRLYRASVTSDIHAYTAIGELSHILLLQVNVTGDICHSLPVVSQVMLVQCYNRLFFYPLL